MNQCCNSIAKKILCEIDVYRTSTINGEIKYIIPEKAYKNIKEKFTEPYYKPRY